MLTVTEDENDTMWDMILSILVILHLCTEYVHYILEYRWGKKDKNILEDIHKHRRKSTKTERLDRIEKGLEEIRQILLQRNK